MPYVIGSVLSLGVAIFARGVGLDRDRAFYPTVMIVIASTYLLFGAISGSISALLIEVIVMVGFSTVAVRGFKSNPWLVVLAMIGHGIFDALHGKVIDNAGVPPWWPAFCFAYDFGAAAGLAWFLGHPTKSVRIRA